MRLPFLFILMLICFAGEGRAQGIRTAQLKQERISYAPKSYYISNVVDDRSDKSAVGKIKDGSNTNKINLQGGAAESLKGFMTKNVSMDKTTQPVVLHISKMDFDIKRKGPGWHEEAEVTLGMYVGDRMLIEFSGKSQKETEEDPLLFIDEFLRKALESDLTKFDAWWQKNRDRIPTAATVKVIATIGRTSPKPDLIVYSTARPLQIQDFKGPVENGYMEHAATLSGVGLASTTETKNGQIVINVTLTPYFSKSQSWFKPDAKNPKILSHEQTHFDITAIKACELAAEINRTVFTPENYDQKLDELLAKNSRETNDEESLFDKETNHSTIPDKEDEWEKKIKQQIKASGCY